MRRFRASWAGFAHASLLLFLPACDEEPEEPGADVCNELANDGGEVRNVLLDDPVPTPEGGTIALGKYELTALNLYGVNPPMSEEVRRQMVEVATATVQWAVESNGEAASYTSTYTISDTTVHFDINCPNVYRSTFAFTAAPTELRLFTIRGEWTVETVLTKR